MALRSNRYRFTILTIIAYQCRYACLQISYNVRPVRSFRKIRRNNARQRKDVGPFEQSNSFDLVVNLACTALEVPWPRIARVVACSRLARASGAGVTASRADSRARAHTYSKTSENTHESHARFSSREECVSSMRVVRASRYHDRPTIIISSRDTSLLTYTLVVTLYTARSAPW